jgi:hypothetical protein
MDIAYEPNINSCLMMHLSKESFSYVTTFLNNLGLDMAGENLSILMELIGTMTLVNGFD